MTDIAPAYTRVRGTDPDTSYEAAEAIAPKITDVQNHVLQILGRHPRGLTDHELQLLAGKSDSTYRSRRKELTDLGLVEDSGQRRKIKNRNCIVWRLREFATAETPF